MTVIRPAPAHVDARGFIMDLVQGAPVDAVTFLSVKAGAERAHHYHKLTTQYVFVLQGRLQVLTQRLNEGVQQVVVTAGSLVVHEPLERHAFIGLDDSLLLAMTRGPRSGDYYESDTYRLDEPLRATGAVE